MTVLHVSSILNRESIQRFGLLPTEIKNEGHLESFLEDDMCTEDGRALYTWEDCDKNEKFIRDMIFCKVWINPRNKLYEDSNDPIDYRKYLDINLSEYEYMTYDVYAAEVSDRKSLYVHWQYWPNDSDISFSCYKMPDEYSHDDKILHVFKEPLIKIKIVGQAIFYYDNKKYNIKISR